MLRSLLTSAGIVPLVDVHAHCDLPCGVYDPAQARIEAQSVKACMEKYAASDDPIFQARAIEIKEQRSHMVKEHLWVLWTDYFKPVHLETYPDLHDKIWKATKLCSAAKVGVDLETAEALLAAVEEIHNIFWATKGGKPEWMTTDPTTA